MSSFEWNKIIASVLTAMIVAMVSGILASQLSARRISPSRSIFRRRPRRSRAAPAARPPAAGPEPIGPLLAKADPKKGEQIAKVCAACHTFNKGGPNKIGPNLWDITEESDCRECRISILRRDAGAQGREMGRGKAQSVAVEAAILDQGHQDDLCRDPRGRRSGPT